ncbi:Hsp70 protein [Asanoa hainanensis]|uniref:Hsp70 protein n=1 Tax=Asanoa hainanensis TaxID=560556 RepID=A0A239J109_9ACTN|nr:Hsp70 family protein [Asanoa hainanensis]SNS98963.1 Hsp70 protein [Asanoa hainanensis]
MSVTARLGVDIGSATTKAVLALPGGARLPLMPDGSPRMRSRVFALPDGGFLVGSAARAAALEHPDRYLADPMLTIAGASIQLGDRTVDAVEVFAAILTAIKAEATRIAGHQLDLVTLTVPPAWGRIRRDALREAATTAGFTNVVFVSAPAAIATYLASTSANRTTAGGYMLVCDAGAAATTLTVLEHDDHGLQQLATTVAAGASGRDFDQLVAAHLIAAVTPPGQPASAADLQDPQWRSVLAAAEDAKVNLFDHERTAVALHDPYPPVVVDRTDLAKIVQPALAALSAAVTEVLSAADIAGTHLSLVVLAGGNAAMPGMKQVLASTTCHEPQVPVRTDIAAAEGALTAAVGSEVRAAVPAELPRVKLRPTDLIRPALFAASSMALLAAVAMTLWTGDSPTGLTVHLAEELISAAAVVAVLTAWSVAHLLPTLYLAGDSNVSEGTTLIRATFAGAGALGIVIAALYGLAIGALVGAITTEYASHAIVPAVPVAAGALLVAALARSIPAAAVAAWLTQLRHPVSAVLLGSFGILAMRYAVSAQISPGLSSIIIRIGGAATGLAIAVTLIRSRRLQLLTAAILTIGGFSVSSLGNNRAITLAYIAAIIWWTATRVATTARIAYPQLRARVEQVLTARSP